MKEYKYVQHVSDYQTKQYMEEYKRKYIKNIAGLSYIFLFMFVFKNFF